MIYDVIIIGGGPAGSAAAVYSARKRLKTLLITESFGGQSIVSDDIQNWIGERHISGFDLAKKFEEHVRAFSDIVDIKMPERVTEIKSIECLIGEERVCEFEGKGVAYCSTCDAPLFSGKKVAVIGGGNSGLEAVIDLFPYAEEIYLIESNGKLRGDQMTQDEIRKNPKLKEIIFHAQALEVLGDKFVNGLKYRNKESGEEKVLSAEGIFVEIGSVPNSEIAKDLLGLDQYGQVIIDSKNATTTHPGVFAAGDITDDPYKQNNISAGDAVKAALAAYNYLLKREKHTPAAA